MQDHGALPRTVVVLSFKFKKAFGFLLSSRILIHGADIRAEGALEAKNKDLRNERETNARKNCRKNTMEDVLNALSVSSDPVLTSLSNGSAIASTKTIIMNDDVKSLLLIKHLDMPLFDSDDSE
ncbi:uncharacterized protein LOC122818517 [Drosophila biarmipes]|uniref:uncharacterized protein LOC122818517 n=1 Tax=Drosophila biarmipes TaxID=125945 RepID=UPI001CDAD842|nr:uncharacterized protein LOC122818517 [Drosophila biarmipes]